MMLKNCDLLTRLLRARPLFPAALFFLTGCILGHSITASPVLSGTIAVLLLLAALLLRRRVRNITAALLVISMLPLGAMHFDLCWSAVSPLPDTENALLSGRISETPLWNPETERTICVLDGIHINGEKQSGRIRIYLRGDPLLLQSVELGQDIRCSNAHIWQADEASNPGQFNFSNYLRVNGLRGYATAGIEDCSLGAPVLRYSDMRHMLRASFAKRIDRLFPENAALVRAFLLGDRSGLSDEDCEAYSRTGAAHILAISGMHVSILAAAVTLLLGRFLRKSTAFILTLILLLAYGALIGFSASLLRAVIMFAVYGYAPLTGRYSDGPTRLAAAMLICLVLRPAAILDAGFILSYGASAGIIFLYKPLLRLFRAEAYVNKRTDVGLVSFIKERLPRRIVQSVILTLAAQLAILPAVVHFFGAQPMFGLAVNLIAVPLAMAAYILSIPAALTGLIPAAAFVDMLFGLLTQCVRFFAGLPFASLRIARFPVWLTLLCLLAFLLASELSRLNERLRRFLPLAVIPAVFISNTCSSITTRGTSIVFLDAGQADCAVIRSEGNVYLVDAGDSYTPAADYLSAMNYDLSGIFLSHPHTDHAAGLMDVLEVCTPERIYISANWYHFEVDDSISDALKRAEEMGSKIIMLSAGDQIALSGKSLLEVLSPPAGISPDSANDDSMILRLEYGEASALFCGDAPASVVSGKAGDVDILKIAHHGSKSGTSAALLAELSPSVAVIPTGYNSFGHPDEQTLDLLYAAGTKVYRTDLNGAVTCRLNEDGSVVVQTYHASEVENGLE